MPFLFFLLLGASISGGETSVFERLTIDDGLSQSSAVCMLQDHRGFLWFGTEDGLNRYDGYRFRVFKNDPKDVHSLSFNYIRALHEDASGAIWVGTYGGGLNVYDPSVERFSCYRHDETDKQSLSSDYVYAVCSEGSGRLWVGTDHGLDRIDSGEKCVRRYGTFSVPVHSIQVDLSGNVWIGSDAGLKLIRPGEDRMEDVSLNRRNGEGTTPSVCAILEDRDGRLWIGTEKGLFRVDPSSGRVAWCREPGAIRIQTILEDLEGWIWLGTATDGLLKFHPISGTVVHYRSGAGQPGGLSNDEVLSLCQDGSGVLWVGTRVGLNKIDLTQKHFVHYRFQSDGSVGQSSNYVRAIFEEDAPDGRILWIGSYGGLFRFNRDTDERDHFFHERHRQGGLSHDRVMSILRDSSGDLWVGTSGGLNRMDSSTGRFEIFRPSADPESRLTDERIRVLFEDGAGDLWVGTERGLNRFDADRDAWIGYVHDAEDSTSLSNDFIYAMYEDRSGCLWVGTVDGLNRIDKASGTFRSYHAVPGRARTLSHNEIFCMYEDKAGRFWIGTPCGLNRMDRESETFVQYTEADGLPNDMIYGILEDGTGHLWLSTNRGISRFHPSIGSFKNYGSEDGLQSNEFNLGAFHVGPGGEFFFGGINGLNAFYPEEIRDNPYAPKVVITDFRMANRSIPVGATQDGRELLPRSLMDIETLDLSYKDRVLSFEFAALHFVSPGKNSYAYRLEGFEDQWTYSGTRNFATYTNLPPGRYLFRVRGSNHDGLWNEEDVSLGLVIHPPFWKTLAFKFGALFALTAAITLFVQFRTRAVRERNRILETVNQKLKQQVDKRERAEKALRKAHDELELRVEERTAELHTSEIRYKELYDEAPVGYHELDQNATIVRVNRTEAVLLGYEVEEMIGRPLGAFIAPEQSAEAMRILKQKLEGGVCPIRGFECRYIRKDGRSIEVHVEERLIHDAKGDVIGVRSTLQDVTARKMTERALELEKAYLEQLFESAPEGIVLVDESGGILRVNGEFTRMFGFETDEVLGQSVDAILATEDLLDEARHATEEVSRGQVISFESRRRRKDGELLHVSILGSPIRVESDLVAIYCIYRDITSRVRQEERKAELLKEIESTNKELKDFAYVVSHDLKAPLRAIGSLVNWLASDYEESFDEEGRDMLHLLTGRVQRMSDLIEGVLQYSRVGRVHEERVSVDLNALVAEVVDSLAPPENIHVEVENRLPSVLGEKTRLEQLFQNLVSNAMKYMDKEQGEIKIACMQEEDAWRFRVSDNGPGIEEKYFGKIFQIFQTLAPRDEVESTGVGLSLVKKIVELNGGRVWVESRVGEGSSFLFTLPMETMAA